MTRPKRQPHLKKVVELALVVVCGAVMLLSVARRNIRAAETPAPTASAVLPASAAPSAPPIPVVSADPWPEASGPEEASCSIPDEGRGSYSPPKRLPLGTLSVPPIEGNRYDLLLHMHGGQAVMRVVAPADLGLAIVTIDSGVGSKAYSDALYGPDALEDILENVGRELEPKVLRHLILSSWSAGYGGIREILKQHPTSASAVVLLDSVHAGYAPDGETLIEVGLNPFISLAHRAELGETRVVLTHSDIRPPTFASTTEVADHLLAELGGRRAYAGLIDTFGVEHKTQFDVGEFTLRGYTGATKGAHCAHLRMLRGILKDDVLPRLRTPEP